MKTQRLGITRFGPISKEDIKDLMVRGAGAAECVAKAVTGLGYIDVPDYDSEYEHTEVISRMWRILESHGIHDTHGGDTDTMMTLLYEGKSVYSIMPLDMFRPDTAVLQQVLNGVNYTDSTLSAPIVRPDRLVFAVTRLTIPSDTPSLRTLRKSLSTPGEMSRLPESLLSTSDLVGTVTVPFTGHLENDSLAAFRVLTDNGLNTFTISDNEDPRVAMERVFSPGNELYSITPITQLSDEQRTKALNGVSYRVAAFPVAMFSNTMVS